MSYCLSCLAVLNGHQKDRLVSTSGKSPSKEASLVKSAVSPGVPELYAEGTSVHWDFRKNGERLEFISRSQQVSRVLLLLLQRLLASFSCFTNSGLHSLYSILNASVHTHAIHFQCITLDTPRRNTGPYNAPCTILFYS